MALKTNTAEGGTSGTTVSTGNSGGASGNAFTVVTIASGTLVYHTDAAYKGSLGYKIQGGGSGRCCAILTPASATNASAWRFYFKFPAVPSSGAISIFEVSNGTYDATRLALILTDDATLRVQDATSSYPSIWSGSPDSATLSTDTWYRIEGGLNNSGGNGSGVLTLSVYAGDSLSALTSASTSSGSFGSSSLASFLFGRTQTTDTMLMRMDDLAIESASATFIGPSAAPGTDISSGYSTIAAAGYTAAAGLLVNAGTG